MKRLLLRYFVSLFVAAASLTTARAQEYYDNVNSPRQWYYNSLETATAGTPSTWFANGGSASSGAAVTIATSSMSAGGARSMTTVGGNAWGYARWNFLANSATGSGTSLNNRPWEWEFDYKNVTGSFTYNPDSTLSTAGGGSAGMVAGRDSWRYWLMAKTYSANNTQGLYVTQVANTLKVIQKYGNNYNDSRICASIAMPNNTNTYQIRCVRSVTGYWIFYIYNRTTGVTTSSGEINISQTIQNNSYYLSYLEATSAAAGRFQWDNFNFYQVKIDYVPITSDPGLTTGIYPGIVDAIPYAVQVNVRGDVQPGRMVVNFTSDGQALFTSGAIYKTNTVPTISKSTGTFLANFNVNNVNTSQANLPSSEYYYSGGNTDGTTSNVTNYFYVFQGRNPFYGSAGTSISFSVSKTYDDNYNNFFQTQQPYSTSSANSSSPAVSVVDIWDWTGANNTWTSTANAWLKNGVVVTTNPSAATDIVRIGVVAYTGSNQPTLNSTRTINQLIFGSNNSPSLTIASPLTTNDDIIFNSSSNVTITNNNTITVNADIVLNSSATVQINGTGGILVKGDFSNATGATYRSGANTTTFNGSAQAITNNNTTASPTVTFNNLTFSTSGTKTFSGSGYTAVGANGILTLGASVIIAVPSTATHLQLLASSSSYAQIATIPSSASIQGNIDYQVYFTPGTRGYRSMASPIYEGSYNSSNGNFTLSNLKSTFIITGAGGVSNNFDASTNNGATLRTYNPPADNYTFVPISNTIPTGVGYYMYFRGNRTPTGAVTTSDPFGSKTYKGNGNYATPEAVTYNYTGIPNQGNVTIATLPWLGSYYYYSANPYAATLDADAVINATQYYILFTGPYYHITRFIWTWNPSSGSYAVYNQVTPGSSTNGAKRYIVPGQGFFVKNNVTAAFPVYSVVVDESMKSTGNIANAVRFLGTSVPSADVEPASLKLQLLKSDPISDEIAVTLNKAAKDSLDQNDAGHLNGDFMNLTTITKDNQYLSIDSRPQTGNKTIVPLFFNVATDTTYTIKSTYNSPMMANYKVTLFDSLQNSYIDITKTAHSFPVYRSQAATYGKRFKLVIEPQAAPKTYLELSARLGLGRKGLVNWKTNAYLIGTNYQIQRSQDNVNFVNVGLSQIGKEGFPNNSFDVVDNDIQLGKNYYRLAQTDVFGNTINSASIMLNNDPNLGPVDKTNGFKLYPNPVSDNFSIVSDKSYTGKITMTLYKVNSDIIFTKTLTQLNAFEPVQEYVSQLRTGVYFVELKDANNKVLTTLKFIKN